MTRRFPAEAVFRFETRDAEYGIELCCRSLGDDLLVSIGGGHRPHIGAVSISMPARSANPPHRETVTTSTHTLPGHRDDHFSARFSARVAKATGRLCVMSVGIHVDAADSKTIARLEEIASRQVDELIMNLSA